MEYRKANNASYLYLQARKLDQCLHCSSIRLTTALYLLTSLPEASQSKVVNSLFNVALKLRQENTRHVLLFRPHAEPGLLGRLLDLITNVSSDSVGHLRERERSYLHNASHLPFGLIDTSGNLWFLGSAPRMRGYKQLVALPTAKTPIDDHVNQRRVLEPGCKRHTSLKLHSFSSISCGQSPRPSACSSSTPTTGESGRPPRDPRLHAINNRFHIIHG